MFKPVYTGLITKILCNKVEYFELWKRTRTMYKQNEKEGLPLKIQFLQLENDRMNFSFISNKFTPTKYYQTSSFYRTLIKLNCNWLE